MNDQNNNLMNNHQYDENQEYNYSEEKYNPEEPVYAAPPVFGVNDEENYAEEQSYYEQQPYQQEEYYQQNYEEEQSNPNYYYQEQEEEYEEQGYHDKKTSRKKKKGEVVSTNQSINLTCTLAAFFGIFGLFLYFADERSNAVRRISVQSSALFIGEVGVTLLLWLLNAIFSVIPFIGVLMKIVFILAFVAMLICVIYLKYQMMLRAYRGEAYLLPFVGEGLRRFE